MFIQVTFHWNSRMCHVCDNLSNKLIFLYLNSKQKLNEKMSLLQYLSYVSESEK